MRRLFIVTLLLLAGSSVFAQNTTTTAKRQARDDRRTTADQKITLVGCVERADQVLAREDLGTTVDSLSFVLIKADVPAKKLGDKTTVSAPRSTR
jgi:prophage DNA circulation protein